MPKTITFRMNGVGNAFLRELGCIDCKQCSANKIRANTSGSLLIYDWENARCKSVDHLLFDCGLGIVDSLIDYGVSTLSNLFISHSHADHNLEIDRLINSYKRSSGDLPLNIYGTEHTIEDGAKRLFPRLFPTALRHQTVQHSIAINLDSYGIDLIVTPIAVWHGTKAVDPVIWVIEFGNKQTGTYRKLILAWDLLHLIPRYPSNDADEKYTGSTHPTNSPISLHENLLSNADELIIETNTYTPCPSTGHNSVIGAFNSFIPLFKPKRTWFVHYSGHEDPFGPLSDDGLQARIDNDKVTYGLSDVPIFVAHHGMTLEWII